MSELINASNQINKVLKVYAAQSLCEVFDKPNGPRPHRPSLLNKHANTHAHSHAHTHTVLFADNLHVNYDALCACVDVGVACQAFINIFIIITALSSLGANTHRHTHTHARTTNSITFGSLSPFSLSTSPSLTLASPFN